MIVYQSNKCIYFYFFNYILLVAYTNNFKVFKRSTIVIFICTIMFVYFDNKSGLMFKLLIFN